MSKFKVGDKVRILDGSNIDSYFGHWVGSMKKHVGKVYTIESALPPRDGKTWGYHMKEIGYIWDERALELARKFNVGDIVVAKKNNGYLFTTDGWKGVVTKTTADWFNAEEVGYPKQKYHHLKYDSFDLADEQKIVITREGKTTIAKLYEGKQVTKTAKARCNPSDEFDFNVGASIALARLTGQTENAIEEGLEFDEFLDAITSIEKFLRQLND